MKPCFFNVMCWFIDAWHERDFLQAADGWAIRQPYAAGWLVVGTAFDCRVLIAGMGW
jgi:hypothetical protein